MSRIRTRTAALVSGVALTATLAGAPLAAQADQPEKTPCAQQEAQVAKAEAALAKVTAVFAKQQTKADRAEAAKAKKAQQMRLAKATERFAQCTAAEATAS